MKRDNERRKHERLGTNNTSAAVLVSPTIILSYSVLDISVSGLAYCYAGWEDWRQDGLKIDIIDEKFFLTSIPINVTHDVHFCYQSKKLRRCGVKFCNLEPEEKTYLWQYIQQLAEK